MNRWWVKLIGSFTAIVAGLTLGVLSGQFYREIRRDHSANVYRSEVQAALERDLRGIQVGSPFPDIHLQTAGTRDGILIRDMLPHGGLILYLAGSVESCFNSALSLHLALRKFGTANDAGLIVASGNRRLSWIILRIRALPSRSYWTRNGRWPTTTA